MSFSVSIRLASLHDADIVFNLMSGLLMELYSHDPLYTPDNLQKATRKMITHERYWVLLAYMDDQPVGLLALNECASIYALGEFGEITELYVLPEYRSFALGAKLVEAAVNFGKDKKWSMLEVGAPDQPKWERTLKFYLKTGFHEVGPRLYKVLGV